MSCVGSVYYYDVTHVQCCWYCILFTFSWMHNVAGLHAHAHICMHICKMCGLCMHGVCVCVCVRACVRACVHVCVCVLATNNANGFVVPKICIYIANYSTHSVAIAHQLAVCHCKFLLKWLQ